MRARYIARLGGIAAVIAAALLWLVPAWAQPRVFDPPGPGVASAKRRTPPPHVCPSTGGTT